MDDRDHQKHPFDATAGHRHLHEDELDWRSLDEDDDKDGKAYHLRRLPYVTGDGK